ncbi:MAG: hypothetical protein E7599_06990, partial [Ruminococcaceae bacterium]|nr:hypothetical protein [Oscillospiraceae bacterium]
MSFLEKIQKYVKENKTLVLSAAAAVLALILVTVLIFVACSNEGSNKKPDADTDQPDDQIGTGEDEGNTDPDSVIGFAPSDAYDIEASADKSELAITVPHATDVLFLNKHVKVRDGVTWTLASDIEFTGSSTINSKAVQLEEGKNTYYVLCTDNSGLFEIYTLSIYRRKMLTVTFENLTETVSVEEGQTIAKPQGIPMKTGYTFSLWRYDFTTPVTENLTVMASWTPNIYTITYDANGGKALPNQKVTYAGEVTLATPIHANPSYVFVGWKNQYDGKTVSDGIWEIAGNITLVAEWSRNAFTVTLDPAEGQLETTTMEGYEGGEYQLPVPSRSGYEFQGWYLNDTKYEQSGVWDRKTDILLVAKWKKSDMGEVICKLIGNNGKTQTVTLQIGDRLPAATKTGFTFGGWFVDDTLLIAADVITEELVKEYSTEMKNITFYAWWKEEGKPGEFVYELGGVECVVTGYKSETLPRPVLPEYISGKKVVDNIVDKNAGISVYPQLTLTVDDSVVLRPTFILPRPECGRDLIFSTESNCISIDPVTGDIRALKIGVAVVTVTNKDQRFGVYTATCTIHVLGKLNNNPGISIDNAEITLEEGKQHTPVINFIPERQGDSTELLFAVDSECVKVENGVIIALKPGDAIITVQNHNGKYKAEIKVSVTERQPSPDAGITPTEDEITLEEGQQGKIEATVIPAFPEDSTELIFSTESDCIELGEDGSFTALKEGVATVKITTSAGLEATVTVNVTARKPDPNAGITPEMNEITLEEGQQGKIEATVIPAFPEDSTELIFSTESDCIELGEDGSFTALKEGVATVKITTAAGLQATVTITVTAKAPVANPDAGITPTEDEITLEEGAQGKIEATVIPAFPEDSTELIFSTESDCIELGEDGSFTALKEGVATVKITTAAGLQATVTITVTAKAPVANPDAGITPTEDEITLEEGEQGKIEATVIPAFPEDSTELI